jgi:hypothetical protein
LITFSYIFRERSIKLIVVLYVNSEKEEEKPLRECMRKQQCVKLSESDGQAKKKEEERQKKKKIKQYIETSQQNNRKLRVIFKLFS